MNEAKTKSQIVEKITSSTNILVTVSNDPSVDALSSAIALTVILNKLGKHTTAIFSGATPPAITFLDPATTFESSIDSLRDFIIALDKEKADHLRYKVEGDSVKIFITPYKTTISSEDLEFSQGEYNVELVLALGVENQAHLDKALEVHGSILHDATVITISTGEGSSSLGSIDWRDVAASSLSEMLVGLTETLQADTPLIDQQVATALLTGIVAETDRFSNTKTSTKVMTIAAQLMAAGADQQLIAAKLQESHEIGVGAVPTGSDSPYTVPLEQSGALEMPGKEGTVIAHDEVVPLTPTTPAPTPVSTTVTPPPTPTPVVQPETPTVATPPVVGKIADAYALDPNAIEEPANATPSPQPLLGGVTAPAPPEPTPTSVPDPTVAPIVPVTDTPTTPPSTTPNLSGEMTSPLEAAPQPPTITPIAPPSAPTPAQESVVAAPSEEISKHSYLGGSPAFGAPTPETAEGSNVDIFATPPAAPTLAGPGLVSPTIEPESAANAFTPPGEKSRDEASRDDALAAVSAAYGGDPATPSLPSPGAFSPAPGITLPPPPPLPDFGALPTPATPAPVASPYALDALPQPAPAILGDILNQPAQPTPNDPGQFKIPGQ